MKQRFQYSIFLIFLSLFLFSKYIYAATSDEKQGLDYQRVLQQKNQIDEEKRRLLRQQEEIEKIRQSKIFEPKIKKEKEVKVVKETIYVKEIKVEGVSVFSPHKIRAITSQYINKELSKIEISNLQIKLQNLYMNKGYTLARVYIDVNQLPEGILKFYIFEGVIEKICFENPKKNNYSIFMAFPFLESNPFNIRHIEQGLEQMNRLQSNDAVMNIKPSSKEGETVVEIANNKSKRSRLNIGVDNAGSKLTGEYRAITGLQMDNLFNLNDNFNINYTRDLDYTDDENMFSKSLSFDLSIPFGYWTINSSYSESRYLINPQTLFQSMHSEGNSNSKSVGIERMLMRGQKYRFSSGVNLINKYSESKTFNISTFVSRTRLVPGEIYLTQTRYLQNGSLFVRVNYVRGLDILDAIKDSQDIKEDQAKAQYETFGLSGYITEKFNMPTTNLPMTYMMNFRSQYSQDTLYGSEQFGPSVRGFKDGGVSAERGFSISNDMKTQVINVLPFFENKLVNKILSNCFLGVFYDFGMIKHAISSTTYKEIDSLSGWGISLSGNFGKYLSFNISMANTIDLPSDESVKDESNVVTCSLNANMPLF